MCTSLCVIQFAKWPVQGRVKTRLAKHLGDEAARSTHIELSEQVHANLHTIKNVDVNVHVDAIHPYSEGKDNGIFDRWAKESTLTLQEGSTLGERMASAVRKELGRYDKVLIVGSDCPSVDSAYLTKAFACLDSANMVLGPAEDGGYVLVGFSEITDGVFDAVEWGGPKVLSQTLANANRLGITYKLLEEKWDVDELDDYFRWQRLVLP